MKKLDEMSAYLTEAVLGEKDREIDALREQVRTLTAARDEAGRLLGQVIALRCVDTWSGEVPSGVAEHAAVDAMLTTMRERDALRARVAELEVALTMQERARFTFHDETQVLRAEVATARDAALEEAAQTFNRRAEQLRREAAATAGEKLRLERSEMAEEAETEARRIRALKAQPARRFVEAEKAETERRDAWIHGIETAAGIVAERGDDVQAASVVYDVLKARVEFERSHGTEVKP